jgi:hypothetical protein
MHLDLRSIDDGVILAVKVKPRSRRTGILGVRAGRLLVGVSAPPERGRANDELVAILAAVLGLPRSRLEIVSGHGHRDKAVRCSGLVASRARAAIDAAMQAVTGRDD